MPEGDVVLRTARRLHAALAGRPLTVSDLRWPSLATVDLTGREVLAVVARGKHLLIRVGGAPVGAGSAHDGGDAHKGGDAHEDGDARETERARETTGGTRETDGARGTSGRARTGTDRAPGRSPGLTLHSHLRMEGSWSVDRTGPAQGTGGTGSYGMRYSPGGPGAPAMTGANDGRAGTSNAAGRRPRHARPEHGVRAVLANREWTVTGHRLGMMNLVPTSAEDTLVGHLGPDILAQDFDPATAADRLAALPDRTIGEALLDQRVIAGIGTFFMAETCFLRGVNPWRPVREITDLTGLVALACRLMRLSVEHAAQVTTGDARRGQEQYVHARSGRPCRRCGTTVRVASIGKAPTDRVAFWCPSCQPGPVPTDRGGRQRPLGATRPTYR